MKFSTVYSVGHHHHHHALSINAKLKMLIVPAVASGRRRLNPQSVKSVLVLCWLLHVWRSAPRWLSAALHLISNLQKHILQSPVVEPGREVFFEVSCFWGVFLSLFAQGISTRARDEPALAATRVTRVVFWRLTIFFFFFHFMGFGASVLPDDPVGHGVISGCSVKWERIWTEYRAREGFNVFMRIPSYFDWLAGWCDLFSHLLPGMIDDNKWIEAIWNQTW